MIDPTGAVERKKVIDLQDKNFMVVIERTSIISPSVIQLPVVKIKGLAGSVTKVLQQPLRWWNSKDG